MFFNRSGLARHRRKHTGEKDYHCDICKTRFARMDTLKLHLRTHTGEKPQLQEAKSDSLPGENASDLVEDVSDLVEDISDFVENAPDSAEDASDLAESQSNSEENAPKFVESNHLRHHLKVHAGIKPFKCDQCDLAFIRAAELKRHKLIHTGNKTCKCPDCPAMRNGFITSV
nr:hypothetical protein BaRGS_005491 [Batillaria attramentaria]